MKHLDNHIALIKQAVVDRDADTVKALFAELTQLQAIYVAAKVSVLLHSAAGGPIRLVALLLPYDQPDYGLLKVLRFRQAIDVGKLGQVIQDISREPRTIAVAYVASLEDRRPHVGNQIAEACERIADSEQVEEVVG